MLLTAFIVALSCILRADPRAAALQVEEGLIRTITSNDSAGHQLLELAFRAPAKGVPRQVLGMFCANVKLRLYWAVYRETIKGNARTSQDVRRMARLARHYYPEIRAVDDPFDAPRLSRIDEWLGVKKNKEDEQSHGLGRSGSEKGLSRIGQIKMKFKQKLPFEGREDRLDQELDAGNEMIREKMDASLNDDATSTDQTKAKQVAPKKTRLEKIRDFVKKYAPKVGISIYTRWTTMWWLMMSCLYTKYYLWDPALDEFIKLKKTMIMYPDFLMLKLQDIDCLPTKFFQKIISACKILNPLLNYSLGQLSLDSTMRLRG